MIIISVSEQNQQQQVQNEVPYGGSSSETPSYWTPPPANQWSPVGEDLSGSPISPPGAPASVPASTSDYFDPSSRSEVCSLFCSQAGHVDVAHF